MPRQGLETLRSESQLRDTTFTARSRTRGDITKLAAASAVAVHPPPHTTFGSSEATTWTLTDHHLVSLFVLFSRGADCSIPLDTHYFFVRRHTAACFSSTCRQKRSVVKTCSWNGMTLFCFEKNR